MVSPFSPPISERSPLFWTKSSYTLANMACVEVAAVESGVLIGDSKDPDGQALSFRPEEIADFLRAAKDGELDDLST